jgi:4-amino-4-deoxy-L-arabinose transferase-like glycosyltransferase
MLNSRLVDSAPASPSSAMQSSPAARIAWAALICATLYVCYFSHPGALGFVGPDEPRYAWIARDMAETGDWVTPRLYGKPWFEKPPLYYWSAAVSFKLFGVSEAAARLPSAIAALLATLALAWLALRLYGAETARWLLLLLPTSVAMIGFSHAAATDMLFAATLTLALVVAATLLRLTTPTSVVVAQHAAPDVSTASSSNTLIAVLFGLFLGLAVLAKGPAALILCGGAVFFWALLTKRWRDAFRLLHPAAIAAFCLSALPWYILCARRNPDFFRIFIIEHNFKRFLTPEFQHIQPFWYYAAVLLIALLPWTALLLWSAVTGAIHLWRTRTISAATCLLLCWAAFCVLFFSVSKSKLPGYILPSIPPLILLSANSLFQQSQRASAASRWLAIATACLILAPGMFLWWLQVETRVLSGNWDIPRQVLRIAMPCVIGGFLALVAGLANRSKTAFFAAVCTLLILIALLKPELDRINAESMRSAVAQARSRWPEFSAEEVWTYQLRRSDQYSLSFYLQREVPPWSPADPQQGWVFGAKRLGGASWTVGMDCIFVTQLDSLFQNVVCKNTEGLRNDFSGGGELR